MKRFLKKDRYELDDRERETLWRAIRRGEGNPGNNRASGWGRTSFGPSLAVAAALAVAVLLIPLFMGDEGTVTKPDRRSLTRQDEYRIEGREDASAASSGDESLTRSEAQEPAPARTERSGAVRAAAARPGPTVSGRVYDAETGEALAYASVHVVGTDKGVAADSLGRFGFRGMAPGDSLHLMVTMMGYEPKNLEVVAPDSGSVALDVPLSNVVVATLQSFEVGGAAYMVEVKSAVTDGLPRAEVFEKYALDSIEDSQSARPGVVMRAGEVHVRGGRSGGIAMDGDGVRLQNPAGGAPAPGGPMGSVTGGTRPPNDESYELMYFEHAGVNPFVATEDDSLSTFAVDVDNASWTLARSYLERGVMPPKDAIRVEEFVNAFDGGYPVQKEGTFRIDADGGASRFGKGYHLLRVGLVGRTVEAEDRKPANLVFVIDVSGSMSRENRLGLVKRSLHLLLDELREGDRVGIVVYGSSGQVILEPTDISDRSRIEAAIERLATNGSTNVYEGLDLAYAMARGAYDAGCLNRLVLCSDGVANNGMSTDGERILSLVRRSSDEGITISAIGFGMGNYNDVLMEKLADHGDGNYYYVDRIEEARRVFTENLTGLLQAIAREVKVQVAFDPRRVDRWRLLGYENRDVADRDFRNDAVDAGEVGSGHQVTALYEIKLGSEDGAAGDGNGGRIGVVRVRYEAPAHDPDHAGQVTEIELPILRNMLAGDEESWDLHLRTQVLVAEFAEILRGSFWAKDSTLASLVIQADSLAAACADNPQVQELARLIRLAADLQDRD
ncbi:von Willebrand factor type A domain-containing protein [bacterium]|nr:von Willebrand factor type A domain-containing protein [bacterium]